MNRGNHRKLIAQAWYDFFVLGKDEVTEISDLIKESWWRSREKGIDYANQYTHEGDEEHRRISIEKNFILIDITRPYMNDLYKIISNTNFMITLLDKEGYVLDSLVHPTLAKNSKFKLINFKEERIGTNALGTCLYLDKPVQTYGEEHCYKMLHKFTTSAAPIHDNNGNLIGCIGITGFADDVSVHTLGMATAAAYAIENKIRLSQDKSNTLMQGYNNIIKHSISDGLIMIDINGKITSVNKTAENTLSIREEEVLHKTVSEVLGDSIDIKKYITENIDVFNKKTIINIKNKPVHCTISLTKLKNDIEMMGFLLMINNFDNRINNIYTTSNRASLYSFDDIIGDSELIKESINIAKIASQGNSNVLILGESGTGKELFAQSIHNNSQRKDKPFIDVNCGALPLTLAESELFGYEGGSYTGSKKDGQPGKFELADGGTIFLDEIGELPLSIQASLLRVIQERKVTRIGSTSSRNIDVMIIAATNKNLFKAVKDNTFRGDLFYRLNVFNINLPSLREHKEDIPKLVEQFINRYNQIFNTKILGISDEVLHIFTHYSWPGNIRELENIIQRAVQIAKNDKIQVRDLPIYLTEGIDTTKICLNKNISLIETQEYRAIINTLEDTQGNAKLASEILGISRSTIYRKLSKLGFNIDDFRN